MEFIRQNFFLVLLALVSGGLLIFPMFRRSGSEVSPSEATLLINRENGIVLDVRSVAEFTSGHIPEARNIPAEKLGDRIEELAKFKDRPIIVHCQTGMRSGGACGELRKQGFARVFNLAGGVGAWQQAGLPLMKGNR